METRSRAVRFTGKRNACFIGGWLLPTLKKVFGIGDFHSLEFDWLPQYVCIVGFSLRDISEVMYPSRDVSTDMELVPFGRKPEASRYWGFTFVGSLHKAQYAGLILKLYS